MVDPVGREWKDGNSSTARLLGGLVPHVGKVPGRVQRRQRMLFMDERGRLRNWCSFGLLSSFIMLQTVISV